MNKKLAAVLSGSAVLVLALSGCSDDEDKVGNWAKTFCDQAKPQIQKRADAHQIIVSTAADSKPAEIQAADSKAFKDIADADRALAKAVESAGAPPVENGATIQQSAIKELNATAAAYDGLKKQVDALDPKNQQKFADGLEDIANGLARIEKMDQNALAKLESGELGQAMAKQPGCQKPTASTPPATGSASPAPGSTADGDAGSDGDSGDTSDKPASTPSSKTSAKPSATKSKS